MIDPVGAVVLSADTSNVDTVIVGGEDLHKRAGKLLADWESARKAVSGVERVSGRRAREEAGRRRGHGREPEPLVRPTAEATSGVPPFLEGHGTGSALDGGRRERRARSTRGSTIAEFDRGGRLDWHVHSFKESLYILEGEIALFTPETAVLLRPGDYGLIVVGQPHALANLGRDTARLAAMSSPQPRPAHDGDTYFVPPLPELEPVTVDARDPRTRSFGNIAPEHMDPGRQSQELLAASASMRTALLVYSGITVKMMVDSDLGAQLSTMFMVQYDAARAPSAGTTTHWRRRT